MLIKITSQQMRDAIERFKLPTAVHSRLFEGEALSLYCEDDEEHGAELSAPANASGSLGDKVADLVAAGARARNPL